MLYFMANIVEFASTVFVKSDFNLLDSFHIWNFKGKLI